MGLPAAEISYFKEWDARLVDAARPIKVLSSLGWSVQVCELFLASWARGKPELPSISYPKIDYAERRHALMDIVRNCDKSHPLGRYIVQTASSYVVAARMLESIGTPEFCELSQVLYGTPKDHLGRLSNLDLADDFISLTSDFGVQNTSGEEALKLSPEDVVAALKRRAGEFFSHHQIAVKIDHELASRAAAGSERIRIRGSTGFTAREIDQLVEHELFVHSSTMINGQAQPVLKSFGLGAPRTTCAQEGIATFAEMITSTMDLSRLRRIALRIRAIQMALDVEHFLGVFLYFLKSVQNTKESFQSAARIFRGGNLSGHHVFTKDVVYLKGLFSVHTFLKKAIQLRKIDYPRHLFVGRIALGDIPLLEDFIQSHVISAPVYMPKWVTNREALAVYLSYSVFTNKVSLTDVAMQDFVDEAVSAAVGLTG